MTSKRTPVPKASAAAGLAEKALGAVKKDFDRYASSGLKAQVVFDQLSAQAPDNWKTSAASRLKESFPGPAVAELYGERIRARHPRRPKPFTIPPFHLFVRAMYTTYAPAYCGSDSPKKPAQLDKADLAEIIEGTADQFVYKFYGAPPVSRAPAEAVGAEAEEDVLYPSDDEGSSEYTDDDSEYTDEEEGSESYSDGEEEEGEYEEEDEEEAPAPAPAATTAVAAPRRKAAPAPAPAPAPVEAQEYEDEDEFEEDEDDDGYYEEEEEEVPAPAPAPASSRSLAKSKASIAPPPGLSGARKAAVPAPAVAEEDADAPAVAPPAASFARGPPLGAIRRRAPLPKSPPTAPVEEEEDKKTKVVLRGLKARTDRF